MCDTMPPECHTENSLARAAGQNPHAAFSSNEPNGEAIGGKQLPLQMPASRESSARLLLSLS